MCYYWCCLHVLLLVLFTCAITGVVYMCYYWCCLHVLLLVLFTCAITGVVYMCYYWCCLHVILLVLFTCAITGVVYLCYYWCCLHVLLLVLFTFIWTGVVYSPQPQDNFVFMMGHLVKLDLSANGLRELPDNFGNLALLQHLDLFNNKLTALPVGFYKVRGGVTRGGGGTRGGVTRGGGG